MSQHCINHENMACEKLCSNLIIACHVNSLRPRQNGCHFTDGSFKCIFLKENIWILIKTSLNFVPKGLIFNIPALVQIMAGRRSGDKPLSELMINLLTYIWITRPQWVKTASMFARLLSWDHTNGSVQDRCVSYAQVSETSAGCLRSIYPSLGMRQLCGDVTMGQWRHN